jgi:mono/diheme cytochrome c family protein
MNLEVPRPSASGGWETAMKKFAAFVGLLALAGLVGLAQEKKDGTQPPAAQKIPAEEAKKANPVKPEPPSIAAGTKLYGTECAMCHGKEGDGKSDLADDMKLTLRDWRETPALTELSDGEISYLILKGRGKMPGEEGRLTTEQTWHLVNYLRSIEKKPPHLTPPPKN